MSWRDREIFIALENPDQHYPDVFILEHDRMNCTTTWLTAAHKVVKWTDEALTRELAVAYVTVKTGDDYLREVGNGIYSRLMCKGGE